MAGLAMCLTFDTNSQSFVVQYDDAILHTSFARLLGHPKSPPMVLY
jgi:hypothetical protein